MTLGDSRTGKLAGNLAAFGRTLRRAGVQLDSARIGLSAQAALEVGLSNRHDLSAALEAVLADIDQQGIADIRQLVIAATGMPSSVCATWNL